MVTSLSDGNSCTYLVFRSSIDFNVVVPENSDKSWLFADTFYNYIEQMFNSKKYKELAIYLDSGSSENFFNQYAKNYFEMETIHGKYF